MAFYLCSLELEQEILSAGTKSDPRLAQGTEEAKERDGSARTDFLVPFMHELFQKLTQLDGSSETQFSLGLGPVF